ncbi:MAG: hypothetical protein ACLT98_13035 [Eggerthellaceae bacterium]
MTGRRLADEAALRRRRISGHCIRYLCGSVLAARRSKNGRRREEDVEAAAPEAAQDAALP